MKSAGEYKFDRLFTSSACGVGLSLLFPIFQGRLGLPEIWVSRVDAILALSVVICTIYASYYVAVLCAENKDLESPGFESGGWLKKIIALFFVAGCGVGGIFYIGIAEASASFNAAATVLGYILLGGSTVLVIKILEKLFNISY